MLPMAQDPERIPNEEQSDAGGREQLVANAVAECVELLSRGETLDIEGFCRAHADLEPELRLALETLDGIDGMLQPAAPPLEDAPSVADLPTRLSGHRILGEIGSGGMGRVLLAADERLGPESCYQRTQSALPG